MELLLRRYLQGQWYYWATLTARGRLPTSAIAAGSSLQPGSRPIVSWPLMSKGIKPSYQTGGSCVVGQPCGAACFSFTLALCFGRFIQSAILLFHCHPLSIEPIFLNSRVPERTLILES